ncbi:MAG TPA: hypothetical protein VG015_09265, partial [Candidatus Dormibacteraeota bacterium]|nr:hypothetical protein [Candidatus Dormibacteraeota bacterium]
MAMKSKSRSLLPDSILQDIEARRPALARHMARAVVTVVRWDQPAATAPKREAIERACEAGLDLFLATAREARPATAEELQRVAQLGVLQARGGMAIEPVLSAYRVAARVAWNSILRAWREHPDAQADTLVATADYVFSALDQVAISVTKTYLAA